jgi:hypothetical protein
MPVATPLPTPRHELAQRKSGGLEITLYWDPGNDGLSVEIHQPATQQTIAIPVAHDLALDAFYHPFAHLTAASSDRSYATAHA